MPTAQDLELDHYLVYKCERTEAPNAIRVQTQFDEELRNVELIGIDRFAVPARKNDEEMAFPWACLTWYVTRPRGETRRQVRYTDQFGQHTITIGVNEAFLAPAELVGPEGQWPKHIDHYRVYKVLQDEGFEQTATFEDRWGSTTPTLTGPEYFAAPCRKAHENKQFKIRNTKTHIVFYGIEPESNPHDIEYRDQFGNGELQLQRRMLVGIPCLKDGWQAEG